MRDIPFTRIYTSPLKRAVQTAELVAGGRQIPAVIEDRIREISFGEWEGSGPAAEIIMRSLRTLLNSFP